jgi:PAS domain S-box-containing protein
MKTGGHSMTLPKADHRLDSEASSDVLKALRESQTRLTSIITGASLILWIMDPQGVITLSEGKGLSRIGLVPGQVVGQSIFDLNAGNPETLEVMQRALKGEELTSILEDNGEVFETHYTPEYDPTGTLTRVIAVSEIITERKKFEDTLRESEERYRSIIDNSPDGILLTAPDGRIFSANTAARQIFGLTEEEICQAGRSGVVDITDPRTIVFMEERKRTGKARGELTLIRKSGEKFSAEVTSAVFTDRNGNIRTSMIIRDITEQKQAEVALRASQEQYRSIFQATRDGLFINDLEGHLVDFNPEACRMMGYTEEEFRLLEPEQFIHSDSCHLIVEYLREVKEGRQFRGPATGLRKDGSSFPVEVFVTQITYLHQPHALAVVRDITDQAQAYQLLEQRVRERTRELSALLEVSRNVASTLKLRPLLVLILNQLRTVVDYSGAAIITLEDDEFAILDYVGPMQRDQALQMRLPLKFPTVFREVATQLAPIIIPDLWAEPPIDQEIRKNLKQTLGDFFQYTHSWIGVPLVVRDCLIGVLSIDHAVPGFYTPQNARLVWAFADQAAIAIGNARSYEQAQELAALEERQKLARELHDSVSQVLYGIALGARTARTLLDREPRRAVEPIEYCLSLAEAGLAEMRSLIFELRPESLEKEGLVAALIKQTDSLRARLGIQVITQFCDEPAVSLETKQVFYRIAQEALQNIFKHSQASQVDLTLEMTGKTLCMSIHDNGRGFDVQREFAGHMGLLSMKERIQKIGGTLTLQSVPQQGTEIQAEVEENPQPAQAKEAA